MLPIIKKLKVIGKGLLAALLTWGVMLIITKSYRPADIWLEWNEQFFYTRFFKFKNLTGASRNIHDAGHAINNLVIIDSVDPTENRSRQDYATLIELLTANGVACIGMDIRFVEDRSSWNAGGQDSLARAFGNNPRIILPLRIAREQQRESNEDYAVAKNFIEQHFALPDSIVKSFRHCQMYPQKTPNVDGFYLEHPILPLLKATHYLGLINFESERYHLFPLVLGFDNYFYKSFSFEIARAYRISRGQELNIESIPTTRYCRMIINYLPRENFEYKTMGEARTILQTNSGSFRGKIVLIVNSSPERPLVRTPLDRGEYPLWAVHASLICQILNSRNISVARYANVLLAMALIILGLIWLLFISEKFSPRWRRMRWILLFCNGVIVLLAFLLLQVDYWLGLVLPVIICTVGLTAVRYELFRIYVLPQYSVMAISVTEAQEGRYPVSITYSPAGEDEGNISFARFFEEHDFEQHLNRLQNNDVTVADLKEIGNSLYHALFQPSIENRLQVSLALAHRNQTRLRIQLRLDAAEISFLPWEYMCSDKMAVEFMALNRELSITRYIPFGAPLELKEFRGALKILVAISSPVDLPPLDVEKEKQDIQKSLAHLVLLRQVKLSFIEHTTREKLAQAISNGKHDVLHFIGHSDFDQTKGIGALVLEDDDGKGAPAEAEEIGLMLFGSSIRLVVLNSCEGAVAPENNVFYGVAQKIVRVGVPAVVAMQHRILDQTSSLFAKSFYRSLLTYYSIDAALYDARQALVKKLGIARQDWGTPVLFLRTGGAEVFETGLNSLK